MDISVTLHDTGRRGTKGTIYETRLGDVVLASGVSPECATCRALQAIGLDGVVQFNRPGKPVHMFMPVAWGAAHIVSETDRGLRFTKWTPNPFSKDDE